MLALSEHDLNKVAMDVLEKAATTGDKDYAKLAAEYTKLVVEYDKSIVEAARIDLDREIEEKKLEQDKMLADRQFKMDCVKLITFVGVTVGGICIENRYMVSSWFMKTFVQKGAPKT